jgi:AcrR family transcriptional regulator
MTDTDAAAVSRPKTPTRERILDAALELFLERGIAGTTVSDIERAVGLAAGTGSFYRHFKSKEDLVVPAFERGVTHLAERLESERTAATMAVDDPVERDVRDYRGLLDEMRQFHPLWVLLFSERDQFPELQEVFVDALGMREWGLHWDRDWLRMIVLSALTGFNQLAMMDATDFATVDPDAFAERLAELTETARDQQR